MGKKKEKADCNVLQKTVIDKGLCTGCGLCIGICPSNVWKIKWMAGDAEPISSKPECEACGLCVSVCPGSDIPMFELEEKFLGEHRNPETDEVGVYRKAYGAYAGQNHIRDAGASGGVATALLAYAMEKDLIDGAVVAGFNEARPYLAEGRIVTDSRELPQHARSKYGGNPPVNAVLSEAVMDRGLSRLGLIGCPCHVHGLRKVQKLGRPKKIADSIHLVLGLFCASQMYFEGTRHLLSEYCGIYSLDEIEMIDYRWGPWPGRFYVKTKAGKEILVDRHEYVYHHLLSNWQRDRCTICLDHCAELSDIALGDYWDPGMKPGDPGWTMVIARSDFGLQFFEDAVRDGYVVAKEFDLSDKTPSGAQYKKRRNPFLHQRRLQYGLPVPDYGFVPKHEPGPAQEKHRAPAFDGPVVVVKNTGDGS
jgi:coenzyme F420 hydrogenase subunit beta